MTRKIQSSERTLAGSTTRGRGPPCEVPLMVKRREEGVFEEAGAGESRAET